MQQRQLFESDAASAEDGGGASFPIHSGHVGRVRFGATDASFALTRQALADLAVPPGTSSDPPD